DIYVVFAPIRQFDEITASIRHAKKCGASVLLITEAIEMPVRAEVDCTIITAPTSMSSASDLVLPLTIAHSLFLSVAAQNPERATTTMAKLNDLRPYFSRKGTSADREKLRLSSQIYGLNNKN